MRFRRWGRNDGDRTREMIKDRAERPVLGSNTGYIDEEKPSGGKGKGRARSKSRETEMY